MSIERVYHCDWRECECHARTASARPPESIIEVAEDADQTHHFCGWDCLLKFAAEKPPEVTIPVDEVA
jgi:hypothetical protein